MVVRKDIETHTHINEKMTKNIQTTFPRMFLCVFEAFLSSKMERGVPAATGGSSGNSFLIPRRFKNIQKTFRGLFFECFSLLFEGAGVFY